jgi:hypothetical protein
MHPPPPVWRLRYITLRYTYRRVILGQCPYAGPKSLVLQKHPIRGVWAKAQIYSALFCSYSVASEQLQLFRDKIRKFETKIRLQSSDLKYMLKITAFYVL